MLLLSSHSNLKPFSRSFFRLYPFLSLFPFTHPPLFFHGVCLHESPLIPLFLPFSFPHYPLCFPQSEDNRPGEWPIGVLNSPLLFNSAGHCLPIHRFFCPFEGRFCSCTAQHSNHCPIFCLSGTPFSHLVFKD